MNIIKLNQEQVAEFYKNDIALCKIGLPDDELAIVENGGDLILGAGELAFGIKHDGQLISIMRCNFFTPISLIIHICIGSKWQNKGLAKKVRDVFSQYIADTTTIQKVVCPAPSTCKHANITLSAIGFTKEATMEKIMPWRGEIVDLIWYSYDLNKYRNNN